MAKSTAKIGCRVDVLDDDSFEDPMRYRWECTCRRNGSWTASRASAEKRGAAHEQRATPKAKGPKVLRDLVKLDW